MKRKYLVVLSILYSTFGYAQPSTDGKWYVGADLSSINESVDDMKLYEDGVDWTSAYNVIDELDSNAIGIFGGYRLTDNIRLEGKYNYISSDRKSFHDNVIETNFVEIKTKIHKFVPTVYYDFFVSNKFSLYAGLGVGASYVITPSSVWNGTQWGYQNKDDSSWQFTWEGTVGAAYKITKEMDLTLQYSYSDLGEYKWKTIGNTNNAGTTQGPFEGSTDISMKSLTLGIRYNF